MMEASQPTENEIKLRTRKTLLWFGIISIIMLFAGLTSAYIVRQSEGKWAQFDLPSTFIISTLIIALSSIPMELSLRSAKRGAYSDLNKWLIITLLMGFGFVISQYFAWSDLFHNGIAFSSRISDIRTGYTYVPAGSESMTEASGVGNVSASFLYAITALHILHLAGGILALFVVLSRAARKKYTSTDYTGVSLCATYWHFLGVLWVYLFFFLYFVR
ncbi:MAG: heme-copper oxidase subunit III [Bacteroidota bacterium]